jgi:DNA (cytosine-5)-methyltransferase 1
MRVLDLFSGIGGFSLGLERAGMKTVAFCEIDPYCRAVLRKHWPDVPIHEDIKLVRAHEGMADVVCGGFPCQPFSSASAGRARGTDDDRYLWPEMLRVIQECKPTWVIGENVTHLDGLALEQVVSDLEAGGYETRTFEVPACAVGHDHRRSRLWILGYSDGNGQSGRAKHAEASWVSWDGGRAGSLGRTHGVSSRLDRLRALGNSIVPQIATIIGRAIMNVDNQSA